MRGCSPAPQPLLPTSATQVKARWGGEGKTQGRPQLPRRRPYTPGAAGRPGTAQSGRRVEAGRPQTGGWRGEHPAGAGAGGVGQGSPAKGGAQFSPVCKPTEGCWGWGGRCAPGWASRGARALRPGGGHRVCRAGAPTSEAGSARCARSFPVATGDPVPWPVLRRSE